MCIDNLSCEFEDEYYGIRCKKCGVFYPHGYDFSGLQDDNENEDALSIPIDIDLA